ncbi:LLM class flavin-dependent oxidoreductase [Xylophilus sp. GW821-FHT01B05]
MRIDLAGWTREATQGDPRAFMALFEEADRLGFDGVWFSEFRLPNPAWPYPSPLLLAAAVLARTERLRVGTAVLVLPLHHPLMLAEEIAQLDWQSGGRIDIGLGRGTEPGALRALQCDASQTRERFERGCLLLRQALSSAPVHSADGPWVFDAITVGPAPVQQPHPPLYLTGSTPETLAFSVAQGFPLLLSLEPPEGAQLARVDDILVRNALPAQPLRGRSSLARYVCIGASAAQVAAQLEALWPLLLRRRQHFAGLRGVPPEDVPPLDVARVLREQFIHGDPAACHAQIRELCQRTGIPHLRCVFNANGLWSDSQALAGMRLFAHEVLPFLRTAA